MIPYDAVVLAGGGGRRLGGVDKPGLRIGGRTLLERVLDAIPDAASVVVVGPQRPLDRAVRWAREDPPGGGPAAGLGAGLALVTAPTVLLLAADLPFLTASHVALLLAAAPAVAVDGGGREQWLLSAWPTQLLRGGLRPAGALHASLRPLGAAPVPLPDAATTDIDTEADLVTARERA